MKTTTNDLMAEMKAVPDRKEGNPKRHWTKNQISALLYGWPLKPQRDVARIVEHNVQSCRDKFKELTSASAKK